MVLALGGRQCKKSKTYTTKRKSHLANNYTKNKDIWQLLKHNGILSQIEIAKNRDYANLSKIIGNTLP